MSQMPTMNDEKLLAIFQSAADKYYDDHRLNLFDLISYKHANGIWIAGIRAVKEAILAAQPVPVIPEGLVLTDLSYIQTHNLGERPVWYVEFERGEGDDLERWHTTIDAEQNQPFSALQAAIDEANKIGGDQ